MSDAALAIAAQARGLASAARQAAQGFNASVPAPAEAATLIQAMTATGTAPSAGRQYSIIWAIRTLKDAGVWDNLTAFGAFPGGARGHAKINWKSPGTYDLVEAGTPDWSATLGYQGASAGDYLESGIPIQSIDSSNAMMMVYSTTRNSVQGFDIGAQDGSAGFTIGTKLASQTTAGGRVFSSTVAVGSATEDDGAGVIAIDLSGTSTKQYRNGRLIATVTQARTAPSGNPTIRILNANGGVTPTTRRIAGYAIGKSLTAKQHEVLACVMRHYCDNVRYGDVVVNEYGAAPKVNTYDAVAYGATLQSVCWAYEMARRGKSVAIVGGWRDFSVESLGGVSTNGLAYIDFRAPAACGGLPRWLITQCNALLGFTDNIKWQSRTLSFLIRSLLDPTRTYGKKIDYFVTGGIRHAYKSGKVITAIETMDGRQFVAKQFHDGTYEGDLAAKAGIPFRTDREAAAASGSEAKGGFRGTLTANASGNAQFSVGGTRVNVNPYVNPAVPSQGLLPGIKPWSAFKSLGSQDFAQQAYNFRLPVFQVLPSGKPLGVDRPVYYDRRAYEPLMRLMAANPAFAIGDLATINTSFNPADANNGMLDANWGPGGMSSDYVLGVGEYQAASTYEQRELVWQRHKDWIKGLFYRLVTDTDYAVSAAAVQAGGTGYAVGDLIYLSGAADFPVVLKVATLSGSAVATVTVVGVGPFVASPANPVSQASTSGSGTGATFNLTIASRVPSALVTSIAGYRLAMNHNLDPHPNDEPWWPGQLYIREHRRIVGDLVWTADDITATDGTTPRSIKTIAVASYEMDSHHCQYFEDLSTGTPRIWAEGNVQDTSAGGVDLIAPLPIEIFLPRRIDCSNLSVSFCASSTHMAFGSIRMELTSAQAAQSLAVAAHLAIDGNLALHDVDYPTLRTLLLATDGIIPAAVLPQVN